MSTAALPDTQLQLRSLITPEGDLELALVRAALPELDDDSVLVRIEAAPINPSDVGVLLGRADPASLSAADAHGLPLVRGTVSSRMLPALKARLGRALPVGNEGAGVVVAAGSSPDAQALLGKRVGISTGGAYQQYRAVAASECLVFADDIRPAQAASHFINPMTALSMVETMRREGHTALVHTAAASNLGQMLNRLCLADGIGLVSIVRRPEQARLLRDQGATHVVDSSAPGFLSDLADAVAATGATLAFDAIGGGELPAQILQAMELALIRDADRFQPYGSPVHKQVYIYGGLDRSPTVIPRSFGMAWGVGGWLMTYVLDRVGPEAVQRMRDRVAAELTTTFASGYTDEISLRRMLRLDVIAKYTAASTGEKYLVNPTLDDSPTIDNPTIGSPMD